MKLMKSMLSMLSEAPRSVPICTDVTIAKPKFGEVEATIGVDIMPEKLDLDSLVSARRPSSEAAEALADLAAGRALRQLLVPSLCGAERGGT